MGIMVSDFLGKRRQMVYRVVEKKIGGRKRTGEGAGGWTGEEDGRIKFLKNYRRKSFLHCFEGDENGEAKR